MVTVIIIGLCILLLSFFVFKMGGIFSPWMITVGVWLAIVLLSSGEMEYLDAVPDKFYNCLILWVPILTLFSMSVYYAMPNKEYSFVDDDTNLNMGIYWFFFSIALAFTPYLFYKTYKFAMMFGTEDLLANVRFIGLMQFKSGEMNGVLKYISTIDKALYLVSLWNIKKLGKKVFFLVLLMNILYAASIMEKGSIFFLFFSTLFVLYEKQKVSMKTIAIWCVSIIFIFYGFNIMRSNVDADDYGTFGKFFSMYILSPAVAFGKVQELLTDQFGIRSFTFFYSFANKIFGTDFIVMPNLQEFVWVPIPTNVYTVFQPFYQDFGYKGVAFFASVYGIITGFVYRVFRNGGVISRCVYAYIVYILVLQFFQEVFLVGISDLIQYLLIFWLMLQNRFTLSLKGLTRIKKN